MKRIIKLVTIVAVSMLVSVSANAQWRIGANFGVQVPAGDFEKGSATVDLDAGTVFVFPGTKMGFGGNAILEYRFTPHFGLNVNGGYYSMKMKNEFNLLGFNLIDFNQNVDFLNFNFGGRFYLFQKVQPYIGAEIGTYSIGLDGLNAVGLNNNTYFGLSPVLGLQVKLSNKFAIDLGLKYNYIFSKNDVKGPDFNYTTFSGTLGLVYTLGNW